jgi:hypothetical protein
MRTDSARTLKMTLQNKGSFLRDDTKNWVSSSLFFMSLNKLGVNCEDYYIPVGVECSNEQLLYYTDHLLDAIGRLEFSGGDRFKADRDFVRKIAFILRAWAREGHGLRVV